VANAHKQCLAQCLGINHLQVPVEVNGGYAQLATLATLLLVAFDP